MNPFINIKTKNNNEVVVWKDQVPDNWDQLEAQLRPESGYLQSTSWGRQLPKIYIGSSLYLQVIDNQKPVAQCMVSVVYPTNLSSKKKLFFLPYLECHEGVTAPADRPDLVESLLEGIRKIEKKFKVFRSTIAFSRTGSHFSNSAVDQLMQRRGYQTTTWGTYLLSLEQSEDEIKKNLAQDARRKIKKAQKSQIKFREVEDTKDFEKNFRPVYREAQLKELEMNTSSVDTLLSNRQKYSYYLAEDKDGVPLSVIGMCNHNGVATARASSNSKTMYDKKLPAQDLLVWESILLAKKQGCKVYDFAGVNPNPQTPKESGIYYFKKKWGGKYVEYNIYTRTLFPQFLMNSLRAVKRLVAN